MFAINYVQVNSFYYYQTLKELEAEMLKGQKLQGPMTAEEVHKMMNKLGLDEKEFVIINILLNNFELNSP